MYKKYKLIHIFILVSQNYGDRHYFEAGIQMKNHIVCVLKKMNNEPEFNGQNGDKAFINTLLVRVFGNDKLASKDNLCQQKMEFIKGNAKH